MLPPKLHSVHSRSPEETPLLHAGSSVTSVTYNGDTLPSSDADNRSHSTRTSSSPPRRYMSTLALILLCASILAIPCAGFFVPAAAEKYAKEAVTLDISSLSIEGFTDRGVRARIQASVTVDARQVRSAAVRTFGMVGTWLTREVSSQQSKVHVYLPDYDDGLLGTATAPATTVDIRNGQKTLIDFVSEVETGPLDVVRTVANDYLSGQLGQVRVRVEADLVLKTGLFNLGTKKISEEMAFEEIPSLPNFQVNQLNFEETTLPDQKAMNANVSVTIENPYPIEFEIPFLSFTVLLPGCEARDLVFVATAETSRLLVEPKTDINVEISAVIRNLPDGFVNACPKSHTSPMDKFLGGYLHGNDTIVFVRGTDSQRSNVPQWLLEFLRSVTLPVPFPGHTFNDVVKSFSLSNVKFRLPAPDAEHGSPDSFPQISASVVAIVRIPEEMNFPIDVKHLRAMADVSYEGERFGTLDLHKWMPADSILSGDNKHVEIHAEVDNALLDVTDYDIFERVIRKLMFGKAKSLQLGIKCDTDVHLKTNLGEFVVSHIPAAGNITIDSFPEFGSTPFPKANQVIIEDTTPHSITLRINLSINNPTPWEAIVPYVNVNITHENMILGNSSISNLHILPGANTLDVWAIWDPRSNGGHEAERVGAQLLGEYVSGRNTTLTIRPHTESLPSLPLLSRALADFELTIPTPRLGEVDDPGDNAPLRFIESATIHVLSSTADFIINNPLRNNRITIKKVNGTAKYNGSDLGTILYEWPFDILDGKQGKTLTPRLPVDWGSDNVGYEIVKKALRGQLRVYAEALCLVGIENFSIELFYNSSNPIGAHVGL